MRARLLTLGLATSGASAPEDTSRLTPELEARLVAEGVVIRDLTRQSRTVANP